MPRDISGNYTLPAGNPVIAATIIDVNWANPTLNDIAVQLNNVLTLDGVTRPLAPIRFLTGSAAVPSITFFGDTNTGIYSPAADQLAIALGGAQVVSFTSTGIRITLGDNGPPIVILDTSTAAVSNYTQFQRAGVPDGLLGSVGAIGALCGGSAVGDLVLRTENKSLILCTNGGSSAAVTITPTNGITMAVPSSGAFPTLSLEGRNNQNIQNWVQGLNSARLFPSDSLSPPGVAFGLPTARALHLQTNSLSRLVIESDGRVFGTGLHNNGVVSGTANQYIASGTFTPTMFPGLNVIAATGLKCQWLRVGNVVTVSGECQIQTVGVAVTTCGMELPIPSNLAVPNDCSGVIQQRIGATVGGLLIIGGDTVNNRANIQFTAVAASTNNYGFHYTYEVL